MSLKPLKSILGQLVWNLGDFIVRRRLGSVKLNMLCLLFLLQVDVFVAMDYHKRSYGSFHGRVHLQGSSPMDASLVITEITLEDYGRYKCEVIDGLEDGTVVVSLDLEGMIVSL